MKIYVEEEKDNIVTSQEKELKQQRKGLDDKERSIKRTKLMKQIAKLNQE